MKYLVKTGWILNPNPKVVNNITAAIERNQGHCPCHNPDSGTDKDICPCRSYRENDTCHCNLYIKISDK